MENHTLLEYPKISVITPSLNQGQFIDATIRSVLSQEYPNLEYIIMDGGSTDNTLDILRSYSDRVRWLSEKDTGQSHAINKGLLMASGEILAYLNADDLLLPGALKKIAETFLDHPETMWITGRCRIIDENGQEVRRLVTAYKNLWLFMQNRSLLLITDYVSQPATFWRADAYREFGSFKEGLHYTMDYDYWLRLNIKYPLMVIPRYLAAFRVHSQSKNITAGHKEVYVDEEKTIINQYTKSKFLLALHDVHRWLMTTVYSIMNG